MTWDVLVTLILEQIPSSERKLDALVNLSKEPDRLSDIGPIGDLRKVGDEWVMELEDDE